MATTATTGAGTVRGKGKVLVAIFVASLLVQSINSLSLLTTGVMGAFPGTSAVQAQLIISIGNLVGLVGMIIAGKMVNFTTKKVTILVMMAVMVAGALMGYFASVSLTMVYVACGVFGLGSGGLIPLTSGLIAEHFDGATRATVMGTQSIFVNGGGMLFNFVGGFAVAADWKNLFLVLLSTIVVMLVVAVLLPKGTVEKPVEQPQGSETGAKAVKRSPLFTKFLVIFMIGSFFNGLAFMTFMANITMDVVGLGLGDAATAGIINTVLSVGAMITGILIARIWRGLKRYVFAFGLTLGTISLWICSVATSVPVLAIAGLLMGCAFTLHNTPYYSVSPANASPENMTMTMSLFTVAMQIGMVVCPLIVTPLAAAIGSAVAVRFGLGAAVMTVVAVLAWFAPRMLKDYRLSLE